MRDHNICENCDLYFAISTRSCSQCRQPLVLDPRGSIEIWRLGDIEDGALGPIMAGVRRIFGKRVVLQPGFIDERPSARAKPWKGIAASTFLNQLVRRHRSGTYLSLGISEMNIVSCTQENYLFGLGCETSAVMSLHPLREDGADEELVRERAVKIAAHELGHGLGLDHHGYDDGIECLMIGDTELDTVGTVDAGTDRFCRECLVAVR